MDIITITDDAKIAIASLINKISRVEYGMMIGYPRLIDHIVNFEKIKDKQLINDIAALGKESLGHYEKDDILVTRLGSKLEWQLTILPRLVDVPGEFEKQLKGEFIALDTYKEVKKIVMHNKRTIRGRELFGMAYRVRSGVNEDVVTADEIVATLDRLIIDEGRHARIVQNSLITFNALKKC